MNENKVLEETWEVQRYVVEMKGDAGRQLGTFIDDADAPEWPSCDRDRAQLAAAAPEMARLLIEVQWAGVLTYQYEGGGDPCCPVCEGEEPRHEPDCKLVAVLRKAGVLEPGPT